MSKTALTLVIILFLAACLLQWAVDGTPAGADPEKGADFTSAESVLDSLGGIRQYLAYNFFIKTDKLHHAYYGNPEEEAELIPYFILISMLDPNYVDAYFVGSGLMSEQGRNQEAIDFTMRGLEFNPESADLYFSLADLYLIEKRYLKAAEAFENALQYEPEISSRFMILRGLAASYRALGEEEKAVRALMDLGLYLEVLKYSPSLGRTDVEKIMARINTVFNEVSEIVDDDGNARIEKEVE